jgi:micrococcal nuclease
MQNLDIKKYLNLKSLLYLLVLVFAYYLGDVDLQSLMYKRMNINNSSQTKTELKTSEYLVTRVVDGDTVHAVDTSGKEEILRFLAVDTLEKNSTNPREKCLANLQTKFTNDNLLNKSILLETDETQGERDKYGRLLVYVKVPLQPPPSGEASDTYYIYNEKLLETGNAKVFYAAPPAKNIKKYIELEKTAKEKMLGMWNPELCN